MIKIKSNYTLFTDAQRIALLADDIFPLLVQNDMELSIDDLTSYLARISNFEKMIAKFKVNLGHHIKECNK